eukprot:SAG11_NODE_36653_length_260_cov_1.260870_1_plen_52_part_10
MEQFVSDEMRKYRTKFSCLDEVLLFVVNYASSSPFEGSAASNDAARMLRQAC